MYKHIEEIALNSWPAEHTLLMRGWIVRCAGGYTKRSNSVSPLYDAPGQGRQTDELIHACERFYAGRGLDTIFKITPFVRPTDIDSILERRGYRYADESEVRLLDLRNAPAPQRSASVSEEWDDAWHDGMASCNRLSPAQIAVSRRMLRGSVMKQALFTLVSGGVPVAYGLGVVQGDYVGLYDIVTDASCRRRGFGEQLALNILQWGKRNGATHSYLQVVRQNEAAVRLYDKIGFRPVYRYWYRIKERIGE
ncbi:GNAT family N-acetyltransferase [Paenibacillus sp. GYB003]|uniref:GNAT family N-acetyltransferase n=1 Tax=Paenibacillus sp. GYB003 TaxID=2994392 RepID=UPI002F96CA6E